jgi:hypothetical protein
MVKVGMYKQQQYDEGVQKINDWLDQTAALPVSRQVDKQYLQSSLNNLTSELKNVAGADFSNQQLIQSVGGATKRLVNDKIIRAGVASTYQLQSEREIMEADRKAGKLNPANETDFNLKVSNYLTSEKLTDDYGNPIQFKDQYFSAVDWNKILQDEMSKVQFDETETEEIPVTVDPVTGKKSYNTDVLIQKASKGILPAKVKNVVDRVFNRPEVSKQLGIESRYKYLGYTPERMIAEQEESFKYLEERAKLQKAKYAIQSDVSTKDSGYNAMMIKDIDDLLAEQRKRKDDFIKLINTDFDAAKFQSYLGDEKERLVQEYSFSRESSKMVENPAATMALKRADFQFKQAKEVFDEWAMREKLNIDRENLSINRYEARIKQMIAEGKLNADGSPKVSYYQDSINPEIARNLGKGSFDDRTAQLEAQRMQMQAELLTSLGFGDLYFRDKGEYKLNVGKFKSPELRSRYALAMEALNKAHMDGSITPELRDVESKFYNLTSVVMDRKDKQQQIEKSYEPILKNLDKVLDPFGNKIVSTNWEGKTTVFTKKDIVDLYLAKEGPTFGTTTESEDARKRLKAKFNFSDRDIEALGTGEIAAPSEGFDWTTVNYPFQPVPSSYGPGLNSYNILSTAYAAISKAAKNNPAIKQAFTKREELYRGMQEQTPYMYGVSNVAKPEDLRNISQIFQAELNKATLRQSNTGVFEKPLQWLSGEEKDLRKNMYTFYRGGDDKWYIQMQRNDGGKIEYSEPVEVSYNTVNMLGGSTNQNKELFQQTFGNFLETNRYEGTTSDFSSLHANNTAIMRSKVGKYSVGVHLRASQGGYVPYAYINDSNGNPIASGVKMNMAVFAKDKTLPAETRKYLSSQPLLLTDEDAVTKLQELLSNERYFDLLLKN